MDMPKDTTVRIYIRESPSWKESRARLVRALGKTYSSHKPFIILNFSYDHEGDLDYPCTVLNPNIVLMQDKILMNYFMDEFEILHPKTYYYPFEKLPWRGDCVVKPQKGMCGSSISFTTFKKMRKERKKKFSYTLNRNKFIQEYIPFEKEFRVVVDMFGVLAIKEKKGDNKCKSYSRTEWVETENKELGKFAVGVAEKFGVDFTGIDIGLYNGKYIVIELNSAPGISKCIAKKFADHLQWKAVIGRVGKT